jgi:hypothetical protein
VAEQESEHRGDCFAVNYSINRAIYCDDAMIEQMCTAIMGGSSKEA